MTLRSLLLLALFIPFQAKAHPGLPGDSITAGYGLDEMQPIPPFAGRAARLVYRHAGVSGDTTAGGLSVDWILKSSPRRSWSPWGRRACAHQPAETRRTRRDPGQGQGDGALPYLAGMLVPTNYGPDYFFDVKCFIRAWPKRAGAGLYLLLEGVGGRPELNQADGLHPRRGQKILTQKYRRLPSGSACPRRGNTALQYPLSPKTIRSRRDL